VVRAPKTASQAPLAPFTRDQFDFMLDVMPDDGTQLKRVVGGLVEREDVANLRRLLELGFVRELHPVEVRNTPIEWMRSDKPALAGFALEWVEACGLDVRTALTMLLLERLTRVSATREVPPTEPTRAVVNDLMAAGADPYSEPRCGSQTLISPFSVALKKLMEEGGEDWISVIEDMLDAAPGVIPCVRGSSIFGLMSVRVSHDFSSGRAWSLIQALGSRIASGDPAWVPARAELEAHSWTLGCDAIGIAQACMFYPVAIEPGLPAVAARLLNNASVLQASQINLHLTVHGEMLERRWAKPIDPEVRVAWTVFSKAATRARSTLAAWLLMPVDDADARVRTVLTGFFRQARLGGADLDVPLTARGHTALQIASGFGSIGMVRSLMDAGANPAAQGYKKMSASEFAQSYRADPKRDEVLRLLLAQEALTLLGSVADRTRAQRAAAETGEPGAK
jgi:hypothetical protein